MPNIKKGIFAIIAIMLFACVGYASDAPTTKTHLPNYTVIEKANVCAQPTIAFAVVTVSTDAIVNVFTCGFYLDLCARIKQTPEAIKFTPQETRLKYSRPPNLCKGDSNLHPTKLIRYCLRQKIVV